MADCDRSWPTFVFAVTPALLWIGVIEKSIVGRSLYLPRFVLLLEIGRAPEAICAAAEVRLLPGAVGTRVMSLGRKALSWLARSLLLLRT